MLREYWKDVHLFVLVDNPNGVTEWNGKQYFNITLAKMEQKAHEWILIYGYSVEETETKVLQCQKRNLAPAPT